MRTVLSHDKLYQSIYHIAGINHIIKSFSLLTVNLLAKFIFTMNIKNFLVRKKRERSINSMDGDENKRPCKASSYDDSIAKAAKNGEVQRSIKIR